MNDALYIAATGMQSQQANVNTIANNMANATTPGFKRGRVNFLDLMYRGSAPAASTDVALPAGNAIRQGSGVGVGSLFKFFGPGDLTNTGNPMDLSVRGDGFLEVEQADGMRAYWRGGALKVTPDGVLATAAGHVLAPQIQVGRDNQPWAIEGDGRVVGKDRAGRTIEIGRLDLHTFAHPGGMAALGDGLYRPTDASGEPTVQRPGVDGAATLVQGAQEQSNVRMIDEMIALMVAQRAYAMNSKVMQVADELVSMSNNLRK